MIVLMEVKERIVLIRTQSLTSEIDICLLYTSYNNPQRSTTGFDLRRLNMLLAVLEKRAGFKLIQKDVFLNITGGDVYKRQMISRATSILSSSQRERPISPPCALTKV